MGAPGWNKPQDAVYSPGSVDAQGKPFNASTEYVVHIGMRELLLAQAFSSSGQVVVLGPAGNARRYRPKLEVVSQAARALLASEVPGDPHGRTFAEKIGLALGMQAIDGNIAAPSELTDRAEGRAPTAMLIEQDDLLLDLMGQVKEAHAKCPPVEVPPVDD